VVVLCPSHDGMAVANYSDNDATREWRMQHPTWPVCLATDWGGAKAGATEKSTNRVSSMPEHAVPFDNRDRSQPQAVAGVLFRK